MPLVDLEADGHYLNLPVMNDPGEIVGMVDVLKLTYATLEQASRHDIYTLGSLANFQRSTQSLMEIARGRRGANFGSPSTMTLSR